MPNKLRDITGQTFNYLTAIRRASLNGSTPVKWEFICVCGMTVIKRSSHVICGETKSCGCKTNMMIGAANTKHGGKKTRLWNIWSGMKNRCLNPNNAGWKNYGGRGIKICPQWVNDFARFREDVYGAYSDNLTIERIDVNRGYEPDNVTWIPLAQQNLNKRNSKLFTHNGETKSITEWNRALGLSESAIQMFARGRGISIEESIRHYHDKGRTRIRR